MLDGRVRTPSRGVIPAAASYGRRSKRELVRRSTQVPFMLAVLTIAGYCAFRTAGARRWLPRFFQAVARGRSWSISPFVIVIHHFMSRDELDTEEGRQRLEACVFRLPINGKMVSMCELNGTDLRRDLNVEEQNRLVSLPT